MSITLLVPQFRPLASRLRLFWIFLVVAGAARAAVSAADGYAPDFDGNVYAVATQADGKLIVGGQFSSFRDRDGFSHRRRNLARLNVDGTLDDTFDPDANAPVRVIVIQPDGRILIGGDFTALQPNGASAPIVRNRIARLDTAGNVEAGFDPNLGGFLQPQVYAIVRQSDGSIVVGGSFTTAQPNGAPTAFLRNYLARFHADGSLDMSWEPHPNGFVLALALHVDDKLLVGGGFTSFWETGRAEPSNRFRLARLNRDGTLDTEFNMEVNNAINALAVQRDGKIIVGGSFTTFKHITEEGVANRTYLGRLNPDGTVDSEFYPLVNGAVARLAVAPDGGFLVGGSFTQAWSRGGTTATRTYVARFHPDGMLDRDFAPSLNATVDAFAFQPDGKFVLGGYFTRVLPAGASSGVVRNHVARFNANGTLDADFQLEDGGRVLASVVQADGRIVIAGSFTNVGGVTHNYVARLNTDGTVDATYAPDFDGRVYALAYEPWSDKVIVGGAFTEIGGETRNHIARLNPSGTIDSEFNPNIDGQVGTIAIQPDRKILVGGTFTSVQPLGYDEEVTRSNLLRLNNDGSLDDSFDPYANSTVSTLALQSDGKILVGGIFSAFVPGYSTNTSATSYSRSYLARLKADGTVDTDFEPTINGQVSTIALQPDGKILIGGAFTTVRMDSDDDDTEDDDTEETTRNHIARLNADGTRDTSYNPSANGNVLAMVLQPDGQLLVGGAFTTFQPNGSSTWTLRKYAARLTTSGYLDESFNLDIGEEAGNRVDSLNLLADGRLLIGGRFASLQPAGSAERVKREDFVRLTAAGQVDATFDPGVGGPAGGTVYALAIQADDKVVAVGDFSDLGGAKTTNVARFRPEGAPDSTFGTTLVADGPIRAVAVRPTGAAASSQLAGFAWLDRNGAMRTSFAPSGPARFSGYLRAMAVERDGSVLLAGSFSDLSNNYTGNLVRYRPDGSLDTSFAPVVNGLITGLVVQPDGRMVIVGSFTTVNGVARNYIARIDADGSLDVTFDPAANAAIETIVLQADGKMVVGGSFSAFLMNSAEDEEDDEDGDDDYDDDDDDDDDDNVTRSYLARINENGTIDGDYYPTPNGAVNSLALAADGKVLVGGAFTTLQPNGGETSFARYYLARVNVDGTLDQNFDPSANGVVHAIVVEPDGQIVVGGEFTTFQPFLGDTTTTRNYIARINSDSTLDTVFNPGANGIVRAIALEADGALLVGGNFTSLAPNEADEAVTRNYFARLHADGTVDLEFNPDLNGTVFSIIDLPDGSILVGGAFTGLQPNGAIVIGGSFEALGGISVRNLAMINDGGSVNASFHPNPNGAINALVSAADGSIFAGGTFTTMAGVLRNRVARFAADGTIDLAYDPSVNGAVNAIALQTDGRAVVGGAFTGIGGLARSRLARLLEDGKADPAFEATLAADVTAVAVQPDGRILYVANAGTNRSELGRLTAAGVPDGSPVLTSSGGVIRSLVLLADGRILVTGTFTGLGAASVARMARIESGLTVDTSYVAGANGAVTALAVQSDGRIVLGGNFSQVGGQKRYGLARLAPEQTPAQTLAVSSDRSSLTLTQTGPAAAAAGARFEISSDGYSWTLLGQGTRTGAANTWQLGGLSLPGDAAFYVRARTIAPGASGVSTGVYQVAREFTFASPLSAESVGGISTLALGAATGQESSAHSAATEGTTSSGTEAAAGAALSTVGGIARLTNVALQTRLGVSGALEASFTLSGDDPRPVLVRAVGPTLASFGVAGALAVPHLRVADAAGATLADQSGQVSTAASAAAARAGAFALAADGADAAAELTLAAGAYSLHVDDAAAGGGTVLAEVYDAGALRAFVGRGAVGPDTPFTAGFVVVGSGVARLLVRAVATGESSSLDPMLTVYDSANRVRAAADDGSASSGVTAAIAMAGATPLQRAGDAALVLELEAGAYTLAVAGAGQTQGTAGLELYVLP